MSRKQGTLKSSSNIEPLAASPLDARLVVPTLADLTASGAFPYPYVGMIVSVQSEGKAYMLTANNPTVSENWKEIGAGGGGIEKVVVGSITDTSLTFKQALYNLGSAVYNTTDAQKRGLYLDVYGDTNVGGQSMHFMLTVLSPAYEFQNTPGNTNTGATISFNGANYCQMYLRGVDISNNTLNSYHVTKIELSYYQAINPVVVPSVTKVTVVEYTDTSVTLSSLASALWNKIHALSEQERLKSYFIITCNDSYSKKLKINFSQIQSNACYYGNVWSSTTCNYAIIQSANFALTITGQSYDGNTTLSADNISKIGLYYDTVEDVTSEVQDELDSLDARVDALEQGGGGSGDTLVQEVTDQNKNLGTALNSFYSFINNLTVEERKNCYLFIRGTSSPDNKNYTYEAKLPYVSKDTSYYFHFCTFDTYEAVIKNSGTSYIKLGTTNSVTNSTLSSVGILSIALYK